MTQSKQHPPHLEAGGTRVEIIRKREGGLDSLQPRQVFAMLADAGAVLMRGFDASLADFRQLTERFSSRFVRYPCPQREMLSEDGTLQLVAPSERAIPLHAELCYMPDSPDLCWFHCARASGRGGETLLADGMKIASALAEIPGLPLTRGIRYRRPIPAWAYALMFGVSELDEVMAVLAARGWTHAFHREGEQLELDWQTSLLVRARSGGAPYFVNQLFRWWHAGGISWADGEAIPESLLTAARELSESLTVELSWEEGDVLVFDNRRFLHGRHQILDLERRIHTRFAIGFGES